MVFMKFGAESKIELGVDSSELDDDDEEEEEEEEMIPKLNSDFCCLAGDLSKLEVPSSSFLQSSSDWEW